MPFQSGLKQTFRSVISSGNEKSHKETPIKNHCYETSPLSK